MISLARARTQTRREDDSFSTLSLLLSLVSLSLLISFLRRPQGIGEAMSSPPQPTHVLRTRVFSCAILRKEHFCDGFSLATKKQKAPESQCFQGSDEGWRNFRKENLSLDGLLGERFAYLGERFSHLGERFAHLGERFAHLGERFAHLGERFSICLYSVLC